MDGWNTRPSFWGPAYFQGLLLLASGSIFWPQTRGKFVFEKTWARFREFHKSQHVFLVILWIDAIMWLCSWRVSQYVGIVVFDQKRIFSNQWCQFFTGETSRICSGCWFWIFFIFTLIWGGFPFWRAYVSNGLKPTSVHFIPISMFLAEVGHWEESFDPMCFTSGRTRWAHVGGTDDDDW